MHELRDLLEPGWGAEKWILEGWEALTHEEKVRVRSRMDDMFRDGLPFALVHDKIHYIRIFSLLAQLEVLAIQIPLKFASINEDPVLQQQMREQLLDEVFHGLVFTKISFMLSAPYAYPPAYSSAVEELCDFVRNETCSKTAMILLNLIAEGWIETLFDTLMDHQLAPKVFEVILVDERRHVEDADLYCSIGLPPAKQLQEKINHIEQLLLTKILTDYRNISFFSTLSIDKRVFLESLHQKHVKQLDKINAKPGDRWRLFMRLIPNLFSDEPLSDPVKISDTRKLLMTQWHDPRDPTMVGDFELDVSCLNYFSSTNGHECVSLHMLQVISSLLAERKMFRRFLFQGKLHESKYPVVALTTRLPGCHGTLSYIVLENCHLLTLKDLKARIQYATELQVFCYKQRQALERRYPYLKEKSEAIYYEIMNGVYPIPLPSSMFVSVSNLGAFNFTGGKSPLRPNEALKFTLLKVERKPVWNQAQQNFVPQDTLQISLSVDHRVLDANIKVPQLVEAHFKKVYRKAQQDDLLDSPTPVYDVSVVMAYIEQLGRTEVDLTYAALSFFQIIWFDSVSNRQNGTVDTLKKLIASVFLTRANISNASAWPKETASIYETDLV